MIASRPFGMSPRPTRRRSTETVDSPRRPWIPSPRRGCSGLTLPEELGGGGRGPVEFLEAVRGIASADASSAMIYLMHVCAAQVVLAGTAGGDSATLRGLADGSRLGTLAFSERGSRSHFWAPMSQEVDGTDQRAEVLGHERRARRRLRGRHAGRRDGLAHRVEPLRRGARTSQASRRPVLGGPRTAGQRERSHDLRHRRRRRRAPRRGRQRPRPDARRRPAVVPAGAGRCLAGHRRSGASARRSRM